MSKMKTKEIKDEYANLAKENKKKTKSIKNRSY